MDRYKEFEIREKMLVPMPMYGLIIMVCGLILYFASIVGLLIVSSSAISFSDVSIISGLSYMNFIGMLMFMAGTAMQVARLVDVVKAIRDMMYLEELSKQKQRYE